MLSFLRHHCNLHFPHNCHIEIYRNVILCLQLWNKITTYEDTVFFYRFPSISSTTLSAPSLHPHKSPSSALLHSRCKTDSVMGQA